MSEAKSVITEGSVVIRWINVKTFAVVSADLFYVGKKGNMIFADRLSGYPLVNVWTNGPTTNQVVKQLQWHFSLFGKPLKFKSDGGAQFNSK